MTATDPTPGLGTAWGPSEVPTTALLTDHYELTMVRAALRGGTADRRCVFEPSHVACLKVVATAWWPASADSYAPSDSSVSTTNAAIPARPQDR